VFDRGRLPGWVTSLEVVTSGTIRRNGASISHY
jgi:hypothetical protein